MRNSIERLIGSSVVLIAGMIAAGCGSVDHWNWMLQGSGTSGKERADGDQSENATPSPQSVDLRGSIHGLNGNGAQLQGWIVVATDKDRRSARVGEVDDAGLYRLDQVSGTQLGMSLTLLSPDYIARSVLSIPPVVQDATIRQYFRATSTDLPPLIQRGPIVEFSHYAGIDILSLLASDADGDGIPDGSIAMTPVDGLSPLGFAMSAAPLSARKSVVDTDLDGLQNEIDPDIDGDGIANVFDTDDDGDGLLDVFDGDANGDLENDVAAGQNDTDLYFAEGVEFVSVRLDTEPRADGSGMETALTFVTKLREDVSPLAVEVRGAPGLLNGAVYVWKDQSGNDTVVAWDRLLRDDGMSRDDAPGDRIFAQRIILAPGKAPSAGQVVFFELAFGSPESPWHMDFPYTFSNLPLQPIAAQYEAATRSVLFTGNPFGPIQDFVWTISVFNDAGQTLWTSRALPGTSRQSQIPENVLVPGVSYRYQIAAQSLDKIPGRPAYSVLSARLDLE